MRKAIILKIIFIVNMLMISNLCFNQQHISSVTIENFSINPPYPIYLSEYASPSNNKINLSIRFTDSDESSLDIFLKIVFEGTNTKIVTKNNFKPSVPISLHYGVNNIKFLDLQEYFNFDNLNIQSTVTSVDEFKNYGGKLPEDFYTLSIVVCEYYSGQEISLPATTPLRIQLFNAPTLIFPNKQGLITSTEIQNIAFQWQIQMADINYTRYKLSIHEITDPTADPAFAIANNKSLEVYTSPELTSNSFLYDISKPLLEEGKKYAWFVRAYNTDDKAVFKNDGISEISWFYYGYPTNGNIHIEVPPDEYGFSLREGKILKWSAPDNILNGQQYYYKLKIVQMQENEISEDAIEYNMPFYEFESNPSSGSFSQEHVIIKNLEPIKKYSWQVKAFSEDVEIAKSKAATFYGPPLMEAFKAGNHTIKVKNVTSTSINDLSGTGSVKISSNESVEVSFKHIKLEKLNGIWFLLEGELTADVSNKEPIKLIPDYEKNGEALFYPEKLRLTTTKMEIFGHIEWQIPLAVYSEDIAILKTEYGWINYNTYKLIGTLPIEEKSRYIELLDPLNFSINLSEQSKIFVSNNNHYKFNFQGEVNLPKSVVDINDNPVSLKFKDEQLFYLTGTNPGFTIRLINNTEILLNPKTYIIDFSEDLSPGTHQGDPGWKGILFDNYDISLLRRIDIGKQIKLFQTQNITINNKSSDSAYCFINPMGLNYYLNQAFNDSEENSYFNTFPSKLKNLKISIKDNSVENSYAKGKMRIPIISENRFFDFTIPVNDFGFIEGDFDESLDSLEFLFNSEGGEQLIIITIQRAVFSNNERLDMCIDFEWPSLETGKIERIENFKIWGNNKVGFGSPNGLYPLPNQITGEINGYPLKVDLIGCGMSPGLYGFGISGTCDMGKDISGTNGPPELNLYSIVDCPLIGEYTVTHRETNAQFEEEYEVSAPGEGAPDDYAVADTFDIASLTSDDNSFNAAYAAIGEYKKEMQRVLDSTMQSLKAETDFDSTTSITESIYGTYEYDGFEDNDFFTDTFRVEFSRENLNKLIDDIIKLAPADAREGIRMVKDHIFSLEERYQIDFFEQLQDYRNIMYYLLIYEFDKALDILFKPIDNIIDSINYAINTEIEKIKGVANTFIGSLIDLSVNTIADNVKVMVYDYYNSQATPNNSYEIKENIDEANKNIDRIAETIATTISNNINTRLNNYINDWITKPIMDHSVTKCLEIIEDSLKSQLHDQAHIIISNSLSYLPSPEEESENFSTIQELNILETFDLKSIAISLYENVGVYFANWDTISSRINAAAVAFFTDPKYFNGEAIFDQLFEEFTYMATNAVATSGVDAVKQYMVEQATDEFGEDAGNFAGGAVDYVAGWAAESFELDFTDLSSKLDTGGIDDIIKFDPPAIYINNSLCEIVGNVSLDSNEIFGDVFKGDLKVKVKKPNEFMAKGELIIGNTSYNSETNYNYWFGSVRLESSKPVSLGPVAIARLSGYLYHHMIMENELPTPDISINWGGKLGLELRDTKSNGKKFMLALDADLVVNSDNEVEMNLEGEVAVGSNPDGTSKGKGNAMLSYSSAEERFIGNGTIEIIADGVCAGGNIFVDINNKADTFCLNIGNPIERIYIIPGAATGCIGVGYAGWVGINNTKIGVGIGIGFAARPQTPYTPWSLFGSHYQAIAMLDAYIGLQTTMTYSPKFKFNSAGAWLDATASVGINIWDETYYNKDESKIEYVEFANVYLNGAANVYFDTNPCTSAGYLNGDVTILYLFTWDFTLEYDTRG